MKKIALIPARVESKRFHGKLLKKLSGVPIIIRTYQSAIRANLFDDVFVVTHNNQIIDLIKSINGKYLKSSPNHESGTDRIAEVAIDLKYDIIVNLQGDEPFIDRLSIEELLNGFTDKKVQMASLMRDFKDKNELNDSNNVKVIVDKDNYSINFSRFPMNSYSDNYKHIGVYAFRKETLIEFSKMEKTLMEKKEKIECLRYIENGKKIKMFKTDFSGVSIDTPEDLIKAEEYIRKQ
ncbi:MAG: 3-deoxy-manno-octulosonate cytidylyltransferase [Flavobacteriaceae bacterium]|nr:3-deoxy-manno-octulosonate cytidylyltransferase [Flavobacteriaceae bacterium]